MENQTKTAARNYFLFAAICLGIIVAFNHIGGSSQSLPLKDDVFSFAGLPRVLTGMLAFFLSLICVVLFMSGVVNLILFTLRAIRHQTLLEVKNRVFLPALSVFDTARLFFWVVWFYAVLIVGLATMGLFSLIPPHFSAGALILSNIIANIFVIGYCTVSFKAYRISASWATKDFLAAIRLYSACLVLIYLVAALITQIGARFDYFPAPQPAIKIFLGLDSRWLVSLFALEIVVLAPVSEELFFRTCVFGSMRRYLSWPAAAVLTSIAFAALHGGFLGFAVIFLISMGLCYLYEKTGNILASILFHAMHNALGLLFVITLKNTGSF